MSDFASGFWNGYVIVLTVASLAFCVWMLLALVKVRVTPGHPTAPGAGGKPIETTGHRWDGDLAEFNNPLPKWWVNLFWITLVFSIVYLVLYPGLGNLPGVLGWTSAGQYAKERADADARLKPLYDRFLAMEVPQLARDKEANALGERLFLTYCAQCHGSDAGGSRGFPNLRDADWLWGGDPKSIATTIAEGRSGVMPPLGAALGGDGVRNVVAYVRSLSGLAHDPLRAQLGKPLFAQNCAACHGADGKGNQALGAPNLADGVWLFGSSEGAIAEGINKGRNVALSEGTSAMPAWKSLLSPAKLHLLTAYVWGLSNPPVK